MQTVNRPRGHHVPKGTSRGGQRGRVSIDTSPCPLDVPGGFQERDEGAQFGQRGIRPDAVCAVADDPHVARHVAERRINSVEAGAVVAAVRAAEHERRPEHGASIRHSNVGRSERERDAANGGSDFGAGAQERRDIGARLGVLTADQCGGSLGIAGSPSGFAGSLFGASVGGIGHAATIANGTLARNRVPCPGMDHDAAEAAAMAWFYAQPADPNAWKPGDPDPYAEGLLQSWRAHR